MKRVVFGLGAAGKVGEEARKIGGRRALLVTGKQLEAAGTVDRVRESLDREGYQVEVFDKVEAEPRLEAANLITDFVRRQQFDLVVGVGGGSVMDMAKVGSLMAVNDGKPADYLGVDLVKKPALPKILVPTTSGTGSEVTDVVVLGDQAERMKKVIISPHVFSDCAVVDPLMTVSSPQRVTAASGIDALAHCVEGYTSNLSNPFTDALALAAIKLVGANLRTAFANGENVEARYNMAVASLMGGMQVANARTSGVHGAGYAFALKYKAELGYPVPLHCIPHGVTLAIALPYVMEYNMVASLQKFRDIAEALGERTDGLTLIDAAFRSVVAAKKLVEDLGLPSRLKDINVPKEDLPNLADSMLSIKRILPINPRKITREDALRIFERMWEGRVGA